MTAADPTPADLLTPALAWDLVRAAASATPARPGPHRLDGAGHLAPAAPGDPSAPLTYDEDGWHAAPACPEPARRLLGLYLPLCRSAVTVAHLGQSVDGYVASPSGDSYYVTGPDNIVHLHRLRALADAVIVGAGTVEADDPRLTTRRVPGQSPVRVVLDPRRRLSPARTVFSDREAATVLVCDRRLAAGGAATHGHAEVLGVAMRGPRLDLAALREALEARGLRRVLVEGGGVTVSRFLEAGLVDRLQLAVAPLVLGGGRRGLRLAPHERLVDYPRPPCRIFLTGSDLLYDYDLRAPAPPSPAASGEAVPVPVYPPS